ncbi:hypothetical protein DESC_480242 [Desulfosarcina cetonica]|nr:hypothetical protein DESC_480242 [Desulfosarcina cetonica]
MRNWTEKIGLPVANYTYINSVLGVEKKLNKSPIIVKGKLGTRRLPRMNTTSMIWIYD